jgi:acyl-ACP thioesterase
MHVFSSEFKISSFDLNPSGQARLTTMASFFQEMAYHHAGELGLGYEDMKSRKLIWALSRMRIQMDRYPVWNEGIKLETWPSGAEKLFALRDFRVTDSQGAQMGRASTAWLILDLDSHRLIRPKEIMEQFKVIIHDVQVFDTALDKISPKGQLRPLSEHRVAYSDLDIVGHVNNVRYMEWCIDADTTFENAHREICDFEINFNHEALMGDHILISGYKSEGGETFYQASRQEDGKDIITARLMRSG